MKVKLVIVSPEVQPNEYDITLPTKIGRGHEAKLKLVHPLVSRLHCELFTEGEQVMVRDLDSLNGTFVDQQRLDEDTPLASGATVMMGTVMFRVVYGADADRLPPPAAADLDKTVAAPGTVRQETLAKIAKAGKPVTAEDLWEEETEEPTALVTPDEEVLDLAFADDEPAEEKPKPAAPAAKALAPAKPPAAAKPVAPNPNAQTLPAIKPPAPAKPLPAAPAKNPADEDIDIESAGEDDDDLDDFFKSIM